MYTATSTPNKHRILMVIGQFSPFTGGAERQCQRLSSALQARGHEVRVLTPWQSRQWPRHARVEGVSVERVAYPQLRLFGRTILSCGFLAWMTVAYRILRLSREVDVIHVHQGTWPALSASLGGALSGTPVVCKIANSGERFDLRLLRRGHLYGVLAAPLIKRVVCRFIFTSRAVERDLRSEGISEERLTYIPNGIDVAASGQARSPASGDACTRFLFVGSLTPKKNALLFVDAIRLMPAEYRSRIRVTILGEGPQRAELERRVDDEGLSASIHITGFSPSPDEYFSAADVFVLPSLTEGLSNAALEAMTWGLPLVLSRAGGNTDLVEPDNGLLIDPASAQSLADGLTFMVDHPDTRASMGRRSREIVAARFSMDYVVSRYEALYEHCRLSRSEN